MIDFGKITWEVTDKTESTAKEDPIETSIKLLFDLSENKYPKKNLKKACSRFEEQREILDLAYKSSQKVFAEIPFLAAFLIVMKERLEKFKDCQECIEEAKMLLENGFIGIYDNRGNIWTLENVAKQNANIIYQAIRCHRKWPMKIREKLVIAYYRILNDLDIATKGYIKIIEKTDAEITVDRVINREFFIKFLDELNEKPQLVAKLLYFGGNRTLDEVLQLSLEDVIFEKRLIKFGSQEISYPSHIFVDISAISENRSKGKVFLGRQNLPLNQATIFRNFKEAAHKLGLAAFSPSTLVRDS